MLLLLLLLHWVHVPKKNAYLRYCDQKALKLVQFTEE
jgi:hypothetical protein